MKFMSGQISSFVLPMKDINYMYCYYKTQTLLHDELDQCQTKTNFQVVVGITLFPFLIRLLMVK